MKEKQRKPIFIVFSVAHLRNLQWTTTCLCLHSTNRNSCWRCTDRNSEFRKTRNCHKCSFSCFLLCPSNATTNPTRAKSSSLCSTKAINLKNFLLFIHLNTRCRLRAETGIKKLAKILSPLFHANRKDKFFRMMFCHRFQT